MFSYSVSLSLSRGGTFRKDEVRKINRTRVCVCFVPTHRTTTFDFSVRSCVSPFQDICLFVYVHHVHHHEPKMYVCHFKGWRARTTENGLGMVDFAHQKMFERMEGGGRANAISDMGNQRYTREKDEG